MSESRKCYWMVYGEYEAERDEEKVEKEEER